MKKIYLPCFILTTFLINSILSAQTPQAFNYQAEARNANGTIVKNQSISVEISIRDGSPTASIVYQEIDTTSTNQFGLFTVAIGTGQVQVGTNLTAINWATGNKYLQVGFDPTGGTNFVNMGVSQLLSVPYALYAQTAGKSVSDSNFIHYIGELYGGGIIVSVWKVAGVEHGLIASLTDMSDSAEWSNVTTTEIGASAQSYRNGAANTTAIISQSGQTSSAGLLCKNYNGGGYTDWYLPAAWELNLCYNAALIVNEVLGDANGFSSNYYWSSTEENLGNGINAWHYAFSYGYAGYDAKTYTYNVRAVRRY